MSELIHECEDGIFGRVRIGNPTFCQHCFKNFYHVVSATDHIYEFSDIIDQWNSRSGGSGGNQYYVSGIGGSGVTGELEAKED